MVVRSRSDAVLAVIAITLLSMLASVLIAFGIGALIDKKVELVFALTIPAMVAPFFVVPLVRANLHLYQTRAELERLVRTDSLTGLANRRYFLEQATKLFSSPAANDDGIAVMMVDIDHFKRINDACGHDVGDRVLKTVANAIVSVTKQDHFGQILVGRIGGEEFAVLAHGVDTGGAISLAEELCQAVRRLKWLKIGRGVAPTLSIGIAMRRPGETFAQVLKAADVAVYEAKDLGRDRWRVADRDDAALPRRHASEPQHGAAGSVPRPARLPVAADEAAIHNALPA